MDIYIISIIILTTAIQSLIGVGVLLFGTPLMLLLGHSFLETLLILLPVSVIINLLQFLIYYKAIDRNFYKSIIKYSIPFIMLSLYFIAKTDYDSSIFIGIFLLLISIKDLLPFLKYIYEWLFKLDKIFFIFLGIIHGVTNLGGSLLTAKVFNESLDKFQKRSTIAISYMTFAVFQIITILFLDIKFKSDYFLYIFAGVFVYLVVNKIFFYKISEERYQILFKIFLALSGILLILKRYIVW